MRVTDREQWCSDSFFGAGWLRHLPNRAMLIVNALAARGPLTIDALEGDLSHIPGLELGWRSAAWEPAHPWTDAELDRLRQVEPDAAIPASAADAIAVEATIRAQLMAKVDQQAHQVGATTPTTLGEVLDYLIACGLVRLDPAEGEPAGRRGDALVDLTDAPPLPDEVLQLSVQEAELEQRLRLARSTVRTRRAGPARTDAAGSR